MPNEPWKPTFLERMGERLQHIGARVGLVNSERVAGRLYIVDDIRDGRALLRVGNEGVLLFDAAAGGTVQDAFEAMKKVSQVAGNRTVVAQLNGNVVATYYTAYTPERMEQMFRAGHRSVEAAIGALEISVRPPAITPPPRRDANTGCWSRSSESWWLMVYN